MSAAAYDFRKAVGGGCYLYYRIVGDSTVVVTSDMDSVAAGQKMRKPVAIPERLVIPDEVQYDGTLYRVVAVDAGAFVDFAYLKSLTLPRWLKRIELNAFSDCKLLQCVVFKCDSLVAVYNSFAGCENIDTVVIATGVRHLPRYLFSEMKSLKVVQFDACNPVVMSDIFFGCTSRATLCVGDSVTLIPSQLCNYFVGLCDIEWAGSSVTNICESAFFNCSALQTIEIPSSVRYLGISAFAYCKPYMLHFQSKRPPLVATGVFMGVDPLTTVEIPCLSRGNYANSAIGRHFSNLTYPDSCHPSNVDIEVVYVHDTVFVHDTIVLFQNPVDKIMLDNLTPVDSVNEDLQEEVEEESVERDPRVSNLTLSGQVLRIKGASKMKGVSVRLFDMRGELVIDARIPRSQINDVYTLRLPDSQRYVLRFDMGIPISVDVPLQTIK